MKECSKHKWFLSVLTVLVVGAAIIGFGLTRKCTKKQ